MNLNLILYQLMHTMVAAWLNVLQVIFPTSRLQSVSHALQSEHLVQVKQHKQLCLEGIINVEWFICLSSIVCEAPKDVVTDHQQVGHLENCTVLTGNLKLSIKLSGL